MPNWKKVITSGSNAALNHITASGNISSSGTIIAEHFGSSDDITSEGHMKPAGDLIFSTNGATQQNIKWTQDNDQMYFDGSSIVIAIDDSDDYQFGPNTFASSNPIDITNTTDSTDASGDTGALRVEGGASIAKKVYVGTQLSVGSHITASGNLKVDGSTILGNHGSDTHTINGETEFVGTISASGDISSSGIVSTNTLQNVSNINFSDSTIGDIDLSSGTIQLRATNAGSQGLKLYGGTTSAASPYIDTDTFSQLLIKVAGTQVANIKASQFSLTGNITSSGAISASGDFVVGGDITQIGDGVGDFISASNGNIQTSGSGRGEIQVDYRTFDTGSSHLSSAGGAVGDIVKFGQTSGLTAGDIYYLKTDGSWGAAQANAAGTASGSLAVALGSSAVTDGMLVRGMVKLDNDPATGIGAPVYLDDTAAGHARATAPDTSNDVVRVIGYYYGNSGLVYFNPDNTWIEVA